MSNTKEVDNNKSLLTCHIIASSNSRSKHDALPYKLNGKYNQ